METLIEGVALTPHLQNPEWLIFDCRFSLDDPTMGREAYSQGHLPGARYVDLEQDLSQTRIAGVTGRHPLPDKANWRQRMGCWGIRPQCSVVLYDGGSGAVAARMWWMLRWAGHTRVGVLDGGWQGWQLQGLPESRVEPAAVEDGEPYPVRTPQAHCVTAASLNPHDHLLLDAREGPRFRGELEPLDPVAGHIPGALSYPFSGNLAPDGRFRSPASLRERFQPAALRAQGRQLVCYCGSGVTAAHNILALRHAGFVEPLLYAGSWSDWITDSSRPVETGKGCG